MFELASESRDEQWRPIEGCPGYEVSDHGHVRSYLKGGNHRRKHADQPRLLKLRSGSNGRPMVSLPLTTGSYSNRYVHKLVMEAFVGPRPEGKEIAHLNGDIMDNRRENLVYLTHKENEAHKKLHGTSPIGERNGSARLLEWQVAEIKYLASKGIPQVRIALLFELSPQTVQEVVAERRWQHVAARQDVPALLGHIAALEVVVTAARAVRASANRLGRCIDEFGNDAPEACSEWFDAHWVALGRLEAVLIVLDLSDQPAPSSMGAEMAPAQHPGLGRALGEWERVMSGNVDARLWCRQHTHSWAVGSVHPTGLGGMRCRRCGITFYEAFEVFVASRQPAGGTPSDMPLDAHQMPPEARKPADAPSDPQPAADDCEQDRCDCPDCLDALAEQVASGQWAH